VVQLTWVLASPQDLSMKTAQRGERCQAATMYTCQCTHPLTPAMIWPTHSFRIGFAPEYEVAARLTSSPLSRKSMSRSEYLLFPVISLYRVES